MSAPDPRATDPERVDIRRSRRRKRTVSAYRDGDRTVVLLPAGMSKAEEQRWVAEMLRRLAARESRSRPTDEALQQRARTLSERYLDGRARPVSVRWVDNQHGRWGSCTPGDRTIRLSRRLAGMPAWVVDYVLLHELVHLLVPGHGPRFWELMERYPRTERARGYLEGVAAVGALDMRDDVDDQLSVGDELDAGAGADCVDGGATRRAARSRADSPSIGARPGDEVSA